MWSRDKTIIIFLPVLIFTSHSCKFVAGLERGDFPDGASPDVPDEEAEFDITVDDGPDLFEEPLDNVIDDDEPLDDVIDEPLEDTTDPVAEEIPLPCSPGSCPGGKACDERSGACVPEACAHEIIIPGGSFLMGSDDTVASSVSERPEHLVDVSIFYIDACEITNAQYQACVDAGGCAPPADSSSATQTAYFGNPEFDDYPVINVNWNLAAAYCEWTGRRLPFEAEWEKAARGGCEFGIDPDTCDEGDRMFYPWGDEIPDCTLANHSGCLPPDTRLCGSLPDGASPYGVLEMSGNVSEWVYDWFDSDYYSNPGPWIDPQGPETGLNKCVRGGSFQNGPNRILVITRFSNFRPDHYREFIGFRCARND